MSKYTGQDVKDLPEFLEELVTLGLLTQEQADEVLASENKELVIGENTLSFLIEGSEEVVTSGAQPVIETLTYTRSGNNLNLSATAYEVEGLEEQYIGILTKAEGASYGFEAGTTGLVESNNAGVDNSTANSYIEVDLSTLDGTYVAKIETIVSSEESYDKGYIKVTDNSTLITDWTDNELETSGEGTNETNIELVGGQKYYIHFGYEKDSSSALGEDKFIINSIDVNKKITNSELTYKYTVNGAEQANNVITMDSTKLQGQDAVKVDNVVQTPKVPSGFRHLGETTKDEGYVISDMDQNYTVKVDITNSSGASATKTIEIAGNEFVWVPVDNFEEFVRHDFINKIADDQFVSGGPTSGKYAEPTADGIANTTEVEKMYKSVKDNGGFYIGRYEAGTTADSRKGIRGEVVCKKGANVYNYIGWSNSDTMTVETGGAVELARNFASSQGYDTTKVQSTLVYGVQWDAVLRWISKDNDLKGYLTNSTGKGHYNSETPIKTGTNENYQMKNIYDMAGNVTEWTMESYSTDVRVNRGGGYYDDGAIFPVSGRNYDYPSFAYDHIGFRVALYL